MLRLEAFTQVTEPIEVPVTGLTCACDGSGARWHDVDCLPQSHDGGSLTVSIQHSVYHYFSQRSMISAEGRETILPNHGAGQRPSGCAVGPFLTSGHPATFASRTRPPSTRGERHSQQPAAVDAVLLWT